MDKFVVRLQSNGTRDPLSSNADYIAQNTLEKPCLRIEQQVPYSFRNKHKLSPPRQKPNVLDPKKGLVKENILIEHFKPNRRKLTHGFATIGMWKRLFRQPLPLTKNEKTTADNFLTFGGL